MNSIVYSISFILKVPNGGFVYRSLGDSAVGFFNFINKRIPNSVVTLYGPDSIIGRGLVVSIVENDGDLVPSYCGQIVSA
jgi:hypothetical protein